MVLVLRPEGEDAQEITVRGIQNRHEFVTESPVQVCKVRLQFYIGFYICMRSECFIPGCSWTYIFIVWSSWDSWSCSVTCGRGTESRTRRCTLGNNCRGSPTETRECLKEACSSKKISNFICTRYFCTG